LSLSRKQVGWEWRSGWIEDELQASQVDEEDRQKWVDQADKPLVFTMGNSAHDPVVWRQPQPPPDHLTVQKSDTAEGLRVTLQKSVRAAAG